MLSKVRLISYKILVQILINKNKSKIVLDKYLKNDTPYKNQINNIVFGVLRYFYVFRAFLKDNAKKNIVLKAELVFYMAYFELLFNSSSKLYIVKSQYLALLDMLKLSHYKALLYALLLKLNIDDYNIFIKKNIKNAYPSFFIEYLKELGDIDIQKYLLNLLEKPYFGVWFVDDSLRDKVISEFNLKIFNNEFYYTNDAALLNSIYLKERKIYIQDLASQIPASLINYNSNIKILDLCSAPGGKTINIASNLIKYNNLNRLKSVEKSKFKFNILKENVKNFNNIDAINDDLFNLNFKDIFDYVLVDAPCSALGTIKRHPEVLINFNNTKQELFKLQYEILEKSATFIKKGGFLIYAVCTFTALESKEVLDKFLLNNSNFNLVNLEASYKNLFKNNFYINTAIYNDIMDTHFIVKLEKKG